jgi:hypothetical protein
VPTGVVAELGTVNRERFFLLSDPTNKPLWNAVISPSLDLILEDLLVHILRDHPFKTSTNFHDF